MARTQVLLVEDEESFVAALVPGLTREGFDVTVARDGNEALARFDAKRPDLVLLDLMLPGVPGIDVCRMIRSQSSVPVIVLTAKDTELDTVVSLEMGADDYLVKPYRLRELLARMRAVLRRSITTPADERHAADEVLESDGVRLDLGRHEFSVHGVVAPLARKEFEVLELLMSNPGRVMTREALLNRVWGVDYVGDTKTLDVHIKRVRSKIEDDPSRPTRITTIRGVGYRFEARRTVREPVEP